MAAIALISKDLREHRLAALFLTLGSLMTLLLLLAQNSAAAYSMSAFEIVRFALLSFLPLVALIVANRLIVREYLSGTRLFVEALPVGTFFPLFLKYILGFTYLALLSIGMVLLAAQQSGIADDVTKGYLLLITGKTLSMACLYWSLVFCFSLCGYLRIAFYLLTAGIVILIAYFPGLDSDLFPPFALMDDQLFVFERDLIPWRAIVGTGLISLVFTVAGFLLARLGEGAVVERLAKPMARRDFVALGVLAAAGLALWSTLADRDQREAVEFSSDYVIRLNDPAVSVLYLEEQYKSSSQVVADRLHASMTSLQASLGLATIPTVQLALAPDHTVHEFDYSTADGVFVTANWLEHDSYDAAILDTVIMHGVMSAQTDGRAMFEPYHWVLDGYTRWWVEQGMQTISDKHKTELLARALWVLDVEPSAEQLVDRWQLTADRFSYPGAEALAWSAMVFLEETQKRDAVLGLAHEFLITPIGNNILGTFSDRQQSVESRLEKVLNMPVQAFYSQWLSWLESFRGDAAIKQLMSSIPALEGEVLSMTDDAGSHRLEATYRVSSSTYNLATDIETLRGECVMKHDYISAFDYEIEVSDDNADTQRCQLEGVTHVISSVYSPGDRVYVGLDYEGGDFHQPLRLHAKRVTIQ